jgi:uncharacterized membrane protein YphA (DoxX/SURF4 family)
MNEIKTRKYAGVVLRLGLVFVFVWFGANQLLDQSMWVSLVPKWAVSLSGMSANSLVVFNGIFEMIMATLLAFGIGIRIVASLLFLHLVMIVSAIGLNAIGIRDIGLSFALLSIVLHGPDIYSYDAVRTPKTIS